MSAMAGSSIYQVGVHIEADNGAASVVASLAKTFFGLHGSIKHLTDGFATFRAGVVGAASAMAGSAMIAAVGNLVDKGNALVKVQRDMALATGNFKQVQDAYNKSFEMTAKYKNIGAVDVMKMQNDARMTFGSQKLATEHIDAFVNMASFLKAFEGGKHVGLEGGIMREVGAAMKSGEIAGNVTPEALKDTVNQLVAMKVAYGEGLKITTYLAAQRAGGVALRNSSDEFRYGIFPALVQEQGSNAGVMLMTAFQKIVAGTGNKINAINKMVDIGLLTEKDVQRDPKTHKIHGLRAGLENSSDAAINFGDWVMKTLNPLLERRLDKEHVVGQQARSVRESVLIGGLFPDRNAQKAVTEIIQQYSKLSKDAAQMAATRMAMGKDGMDAYRTGSYDYQLGAFNEQIDNLMKLAGASIVPEATKGLASINEALSGVVQWTKANPATVKAIMETMAAVGAGIAAFGVVLTGAAVAGAIGFIGPIVAGVGAVAAGISGLSAAVALFKPEAFEAMVNAIKSFVTWTANFIGKTKEKLGGLLPAPAQKPAEGEALGLFGLQSYSGGTPGGLFHETAFGDDPTSGPMASAVKAGVIGAFRDMMGGAGGGGADGGGGLINASFEGGGFPGIGGRGRGGGFGSGVDLGTSIGKAAKNANSSAVMDELLKAGMSREGAAAALGSMQSESSFNPTITDYLTHTHKGLIQWDRRRWGHVAAWIKARGGDPNDARWQARAFVAEGRAKPGDQIYDNANTSAGFAMMDHARDVNAAIVGMKRIERYDHEAGRGANSRAWLRNMPGRVAAPPSTGKQVVVHSNLHMDGKKVAKHVMTAFLDRATGPARGSQMPDDSRANYGTGSAFNPSFA